MDQKELKNELFYLEKVETTFRTLDKAIGDCMTQLANYILVSCGFSSPDTQKCINLLNFLNSQRKGCQEFVKEYGKMTEEV